jgi:hypothetical protein
MFFALAQSNLWLCLGATTCRFSKHYENNKNQTPRVDPGSLPDLDQDYLPYVLARDGKTRQENHRGLSSVLSVQTPRYLLSCFNRNFPFA